MYFPLFPIKDGKTNRASSISFMNALRVEETTRLAGVNFMGTTFDTNFWTAALVNGGTNTQTNGMVLMATNTTANGTSGFSSVRKARFLFACPNIYRRAGRFLDTGTANNKRKFGAYDGSDGYFFQLNGSIFSIGYSNSGVETLVNSGSFNGDGTQSTLSFTVDTNIHAYEIHYFVMRIEYYIDGVLIHTVAPTNAKIVSVLNLPIYEANINSNGAVANVQMEVWNISILRIGKDDHSPISKNISGAATTVLKYGGGKLHNLAFNHSGVNGTITVYDNTSAVAPILATINTANMLADAKSYDWVFQTGLTIVTSAAGHNITATYE